MIKLNKRELINIIKKYYKDKYNKDVKVEITTNKYNIDPDYYYKTTSICVLWTEKDIVFGKAEEKYEYIYGGNSYKIQRIFSEIIGEDNILETLNISENETIVSYRPKEKSLIRRL